MNIYIGVDPGWSEKPTFAVAAKYRDVWTLCKFSRPSFVDLKELFRGIQIEVESQHDTGFKDDPIYAAIEDQFMHRGSFNFQSIAAAIRAAQMAEDALALVPNARVLRVKPGEWQGALLGTKKRGVKHAEWMQLAQQRAEVECPGKKTDDEACAVLLAVYAEQAQKLGRYDKEQP